MAEEFWTFLLVFAIAVMFMFHMRMYASIMCVGTCCTWWVLHSMEILSGNKKNRNISVLTISFYFLEFSFKKFLSMGEGHWGMSIGTSICFFTVKCMDDPKWAKLMHVVAKRLYSVDFYDCLARAFDFVVLVSDAPVDIICINNAPGYRKMYVLAQLSAVLVCLGGVAYMQYKKNILAIQHESEIKNLKQYIKHQKENVKHFNTMKAYEQLIGSY
jgi:hypothetical protein